MTAQPLRVLQVSSAAQGGGAERVARTLHVGLKDRSQMSWMAVGLRNIEEPEILQIPPPNRVTPPASRPHLVRRALRAASSPGEYLRRRRGLESFDFPGTRRILDLPPTRPDVVHCHNLHGGFFDLRQLAPLSRAVPLLMTLHDEWTYTGHCAYTLGLENWRSGCHSCPDLAVYPPIPRDTTHANWRAKRDIYRRSRLYVSTPSAWLMDRAKQSILADGAVHWRVIPNGVDQATFRPGDRLAARETLGLPQDALILLFTANRARTNPFKDYETVADASRAIGAQLPEKSIVLVTLGEAGPAEAHANLEIRPTPYESDPARVALHYQAADLYLHAANADNLPTTIIEAMASGLPAVATAVGGIPEMVFSLDGAHGGWTGASRTADAATGVLVGSQDAAGMAAAAAMLLMNDRLRARLGTNARALAAEKFGLERQIDATLGWYRDALADWTAAARR